MSEPPPGPRRPEPPLAAGQIRAGVAPLSSADPDQIGEYRLLGRLGAGGQGVVYLGRTPGGRAVAVKVLHPAIAHDDAFRERFRREVLAAQRVSAEYTASVLDANAETDAVWMATAYSPGLSLQDSVEEFGPLRGTPLQALWYGLLRALDAVHAAGVVHRDLKPSNVLLAGRGPRLIDFGISSLLDSATLTATGDVFGTPGYMSPEAISGGQVGPLADVFALGCVMVYAVTGSSPFGRGNAAATLFEILNGTAVIPAELGEMRRQVEACLVKDPGQRPSTGALLAEIPARSAASVERLLERGEWLPSLLARATLVRAQLVLDLEEPVAPPAPGPARPLLGDVGSAETDPPTIVTRRELTVRWRPLSSPQPTVPPAMVPMALPEASQDAPHGIASVSPPNQAPLVVPPDRQHEAPGPVTFTAPVSADAPPLPRARRSLWRRRR